LKFLKSLFGAKAEKYEDKADELRLDFEYRDAAYYYGEALNALAEGEDEETRRRLQLKLREVRRQALVQLLEEAAELTIQRDPDMAAEKLELASNFADDERSRAEVERRQAELREIFEREEEPVGDPEGSAGEVEEKDFYEIALAGFPPEDRRRAEELGEPFREAYRAILKDEWEAAVERFEALLQEAPDNPLLLELAGMSAEHAGNDEHALDYLERSQLRDPFRPATVLGLTALYRKLERQAEARNLLSEAADFTPISDDLPEPWVDVHLEHALSLAEGGHLEDAAGRIFSLLEVPGANVGMLYYNLAGILERAGRAEGCRQALEKAIQASPRQPVYRERLADHLVRAQENLDVALDLLIEANQIETTAAAGMLGGGNSGKATRSPHRGRYLYKIARIYFLKGEDQEAMRTIATALTAAREPSVIQALEKLREEVEAAREAPGES